VVDSVWHREPKDDAWREVHLAHVESRGVRLWIRCGACGDDLTPEPGTFAERTTASICLSRF
jgi:hypothetical protein